MLTQVLVLVHPASALGAANAKLGRSAARLARDRLVSEFDRWQGELIVVDNFLSDELESYPIFGRQLEEAVERCHGTRFMGCETAGPSLAKSLPAQLRRLGVKPTSHEISLTGAWYDEDDQEGCVNEARDVLLKLGFRPAILDSVISISDDEQVRG